MWSLRRPGSMRVAFGGAGSSCPPGGTGSSYGGGGNPSAFGNGMGGGGQTVRYNSIYDDLSEGTIVEQFMPVDPRRLHRIWRRIYMQDPIAGAGMDLYKDIPWCSWDLQGISDHRILQTYQDCFNSLGMVSLMPELTAEFLVMGKFTLHLLMNESKGYFNYAIPCDPDYIRVTPIPVPGFHPKIDLLPSPDMRRWADSIDPRDQEAQQDVGEYAQMLRLGRDIPLAASNTLYVPRKMSPYDMIGASIYTRLIMFVAYEKHLVNATISAAKRRAGRIRHLKLGEPDVWEPTPEQMDSISALFMQADEDPVGAIVATRTGVDMAETGGSSPQDMLKVSDESQFFCLSGSTLIPTVERGLVPIRQLADRKDGKVQDMPLTVASRWGNAKVNKWIYAGKGRTTRIETSSGNEVVALARHKMLVLDPETGVADFKRVENLRPGDTLCISTTPCVRKTQLKLDLSDASSLVKLSLTGDVSKAVVKPKKMTPDLAFVLGLIVAEGHMTEYAITMGNGDVELVKKYEACVQRVFGVDCKRIVVAEAGQKKVINGVHTVASRTCWNVTFHSKVVRSWLEELGVSREKSGRKTVPWSILQADEQSQLAFLAAYLEGDGSVAPNGNLQWISTSRKLLSQIQALLNAHGVLCRHSRMSVAVCGQSARDFMPKLAPHMVTKFDRVRFVESDTRRGARNSFGVPNTFVKKVIQDRRVRMAGIHGFVYLNDEGQEVTIKWRAARLIRDEKVFANDRYENGYYADFLAGLKVISRSTHDKLVELLKLRYRYVSITKLSKAGKRHVYDLNMKDTANRSFVSNGLISSNTEGKLGALGISADFLNGNANFSNLETQLSVFLERIRAHREFMTDRVLKDICRRIAIKHGFKKIKPNHLAHNYRVVGAPWADDAEYEIPEFVFSKPLRPVADRDYLDILNTMQQAGIPVPLREMASAGGLNIDTIIDGLDADVKDREIFRDYTKKLQNAGMQAGGGEEGGMGGGMGGGMDFGGGGLGGDMGGGLGGDMGGGMDLSSGGELDGAGSIDTPSLGGESGGGGGSNPLTAAQFRGMQVRGSAGNPYGGDGVGVPDRAWETAFDRFPLWDRDHRILGLTQQDAYKIACRIQPGKTYTHGEYRAVVKTGHSKRDQVLDYVLFRSGIVKQCRLSPEVAKDLEAWVLQQKLPTKAAWSEMHMIRGAVKQPTPIRHAANAAADVFRVSQAAALEWKRPASHVPRNSLNGAWDPNSAQRGAWGR